MLVRTNKAPDFSVFMKKLNLSYFHFYRKNYGWVGHFWQDRFKSQAIGKDEYFIQCGKYIELNPVRSGLVKNFEDWQWSSAPFYTRGMPDHLLTQDFAYERLSPIQEKREAQYRELLISDLISSSYKKQSWGSPQQRYNENKKISNHQ